MIRKIICATALFVGMACIPSHAVNNYYVSPTGSGTACTQVSPCGTITQAHSTLAVGTSGSCVAGSGWLTVNNVGACVHVASGNYNNPDIVTTKSGTSSAHITYISDTRFGAKLNAPRWQQFGAFTDMLGFDVTGPGSNFALAIFTPANHVTIGYNYIHGIAITIACPPTGVINETSNPTSHNVIIGNVIRTFGGQCTGDPHMHGIYSEGDATIMTNNIISGGGSGWAIKRNQAPGSCNPGVISGNTIFNNSGGIILQEENDSGFVCALDHWTISDNIIVNNGVLGTVNTHFGLNYYHVTGKSNFVSNNTIYGNLPHDLAHHDQQCGTDASGASPVTGIPISGNDGNGNVGGCPADNSKTDAGGTSDTFVNFQVDTTTAPAAFYNAQNYKLNTVTPSTSIHGGTSSCATNGISPCVPATDFNLVVRPTTGVQDNGVFVSTSAGVPIVTSSPSPVAFGSIAVGTSATATATVMNTGSATLNITANTITGTNQADFKITSQTCGATLAAGVSCNYVLTATPSASGLRTGNLSLTTNAAGSPQQLPLTVTGGTFGITVNPTSLNFGVVAPGSCSTVQTSVVQSTGSLPLTLNSSTVSGAGFSFGGTGTCSEPQTLATGQSCTQSAKFCPTVAGAATGSLVINSNAATSPTTIALTGSGGTSIATLTPASFGYGSVQVGTSVSHTFLYTNTGTLALTGVTVSITGATGSYTQTNNCPATVPVGGNCTINAVFKPAVGGALAATLSVASSAPLATSSLTGTGVVPATISLAPVSVSFADTLVGRFSAVTNVVVTNNGGTSAIISGVSVIGANASDFTAGECATTATGFTDNFDTGALSSKWQIDTGSAPGGGTFSSSNVALTNGMLGLKVVQTAPSTSVGAEVRSTTAYGFGTYKWSTRMASTATTPFSTGTVPTGQVSSNFILNSSVANPYTEIDAPEVTGNQPNLLQWTTWTTTSLRTATTATLANPELAFHLYSFKWTAPSVIFSVDGTVSQTHTTNVPTANANPMMNLWGTNGTFGGTLTAGTRWMFVKAFSFSPAGTSTLAAGASCTIPVYFSPLSTGTKLGTLSVADSATGSPHQASLTGKGVAPAATFTPTTIAFGNQPVGSQTAAQNATLSNTGTGPMLFSLSLVGTNPGDFVLLSNSCSSPLPGGQSCLVPVAFKPTTSGARTATLRSIDSATGSPHDVALTGTGVVTAPAVCLSPTSLAFGNQPVGSASVSKPVQLTNCGTAALVVSGITPTVANIDDLPSGDLVTGCAQNRIWCGTKDAGTPGSATFSTALVSSPALDGQARSFTVNLVSGAGVRFSAFTGLNASSTTFHYHTRFRITDWTGMTHLELDMNQVIPNGKTVIFGTQCNFTFGKWDYTTNVAGSATWNHSNIDCLKVDYPINTWHEIDIAYHRDAAGIVTYDSVTLDGVTTAFTAASGDSAFSLGWDAASNKVNFQIDGTGATTAYLDEFSVTGTVPSTPFSETDNCGTLLVGQNCTINGTFSPLVPGNSFGNFSIASNAASSPDFVSLTGFGTQTGASLTTSADFGHVTVGVTSPPINLLLTNTGNVSLGLNPDSLGGANPGDFSASSCPANLPTGGTCTIAVTCKPTTTGARTATLTQSFTNGVPSVTSSLTCTGDAIVPTLSLTPTLIAFGNVQQGSPSTSRTIQLENTSAGNLTLTSILPTGANAADVGITSHCGATPVVIAAGNICTVDVTMTPSTVGDETAAVTFTTDAASSPDSTALTVTGTSVPVARILLSPSSVSFSPPSYTVNKSTSPAQVVTANNIGNANLLISNVALSGPNASSFTMSNGCGAVLPAGNCSVTVNCAPQVAGSLTASLVFTDNDATVTQTVPLSCTGKNGKGKHSLGVSAINFGNTTVGTTSGTAALTISNIGDGDLTVDSITTAGDFAQTNSCTCCPVAPGNSCAVSVTFSPQILCGQFDPNDPSVCLSYVHTGSLTITDDGDDGPATVSLQGTAVPVPPPPGPIKITMGGILKVGGNLGVGVQ